MTMSSNPPGLSPSPALVDEAAVARLARFADACASPVSDDDEWIGEYINAEAPDDIRRVLDLLQAAPQQPADPAGAVTRLTMPNGDVLIAEDGTWNKGVTVRDIEGRMASNEEDWELIERYRLDDLFAAYRATLDTPPASVEPDTCPNPRGCPYCAKFGCPRGEGIVTQQPAAEASEGVAVARLQGFVSNAHRRHGDVSAFTLKPDIITALSALQARGQAGGVGITNQDRVREFHETFGVPVLASPRIPLDRVELRLNILDEERRELGEAIEASDIVEVADALTDMAYLIYGTALEFGIDLNACFAEVHRSNMSKLGEDGKPIYREDGKVLKGEAYSPPDLRAALAPLPDQGEEG